MSTKIKSLSFAGRQKRFCAQQTTGDYCKMPSYWPTQLNYEEPVTVGDQEKPCTGMYLIIDAPGLTDLRRTTALEGFGVEDLNHRLFYTYEAADDILCVQSGRSRIHTNKHPRKDSNR